MILKTICGGNGRMIDAQAERIFLAQSGQLGDVGAQMVRKTFQHETTPFTDGEPKIIAGTRGKLLDALRCGRLLCRNHERVAVAVGNGHVKKHSKESARRMAGRSVRRVSVREITSRALW